MLPKYVLKTSFRPTNSSPDHWNRPQSTFETARAGSEAQIIQVACVFSWGFQISHLYVNRVAIPLGLQMEAQIA